MSIHDFGQLYALSDFSEIEQHKLLLAFASRGSNMTEEQLKRFAQLWLYITRAHKKAMLHLLLNSQLNEQERAEVLANLNEEYGNGKYGNSHDELLVRFARAVGYTSDRIHRPRAAGIWKFADRAQAIFERSARIDVILNHLFVLELVASIMYPVIASALRESGLINTRGLSMRDIAFFTLHVEHEQQHVVVSSRAVHRRLHETPGLKGDYLECISARLALVLQMLDALHDECFPPENVIVFSR